MGLRFRPKRATATNEIMQARAGFPATPPAGSPRPRLGLALAILSALPVLLAAQAAPPVHPDSKSEPATVDGFAYTPPGPAKSVEIGNFYLRRRDYKGALSRFEEAAQTDPNYAPAYLGLGRVYEKTGASQKALDAYQRYLDLLPSDKDAEGAKEVHRAMERLRKSTASTG
jgi:tetratricopeptide (TPR) repeat protein